MHYQRVLSQLVVFGVGLVMAIALYTPSAQAKNIDPYVAHYLNATQPVALPLDESGQTQMFSAAALSEGKRLFEENCINCHVGGATLPDPTVPLSLEALKRATPPRDTIAALVAFLRNPMTYDGLEETVSCRQVAEQWMPTHEIEKLAAFVLRAAEKAPGWGTSKF